MTKPVSSKGQPMLWKLQAANKDFRKKNGKYQAQTKIILIFEDTL